MVVVKAEIEIPVQHTTLSQATSTAVHFEFSHSGGVQSAALLEDKDSLSFNLCKMSRMSDSQLSTRGGEGGRESEGGL